MRKRMFTLTQLLGVVLIFTLLQLSGTTSVRAQSPAGDIDEVVEESGFAEVAAPVLEEMVWTDKVPKLSAEQKERLDY